VLASIYDIDEELIHLTEEELSSIKIPHTNCFCEGSVSEKRKYQCAVERFSEYAEDGSSYMGDVIVTKKRYLWAYHVLRTKNEKYWKWDFSMRGHWITASKDAFGCNFFLTRPYFCLRAFVAAGDIEMTRRVIEHDITQRVPALFTFRIKNIDCSIVLQYCVEFGAIDVLRECFDVMMDDHRRQACLNFIYPGKRCTLETMETVRLPEWFRLIPGNAREWCEILRDEMLMEDVEDVIRYSIVGVLEFFTTETDWVKEFYAEQPKKFEDAHEFAKRCNRENGIFLENWLRTLRGL